MITSKATSRNLHLVRKLTTPIHVPRKEAERTAADLIATNRIGVKLHLTLSSLVTAGCLTTDQVRFLTAISQRQLDRYVRAAHIYRYAVPPQLADYIPTRSRGFHLYTLGDVGCAIARQKEWCSEQFEGHSFHRQTHDVLCAEIMIRLIRECQQRGYQYTWSGAYESRLYDEQGAVRIEPDSLLQVTTPNGQLQYVIEYHNENDRRRVGEKIAHYESVIQWRPEQWQTSWSGGRYPTVLVAATHAVVLQGYTATLKKLGAANVRCRYLGVTIRSALDETQNFYEWSDLNAIAFQDEWGAVDLFDV